MTEREIETTVTVEREREVTETYLDDEQITEKVHFCDACAEACDERGGREPVWFNRPKSPINLVQFIDQSIINIRDRATVLDGTTEVELYTGNSAVTSSDESPNVPSSDRVIVHSGGEPIILDNEWLRHEIDEAARHAQRDSYEEPDPDYDLCAHCKDALDASTETLGTAAHEPTESGEEARVVYTQPVDSEPWLHRLKLWYQQYFGLWDTVFMVIFALLTSLPAVAGDFIWAIWFAVVCFGWAVLCIHVEEPA